MLDGAHGMSVDMNSEARENYNFQKIVVVVGFSLMAIKFVAYFLTSSVAIFTDALESIVNVVAGCVGLFALYLSAIPPDKSHPYGHGRIETVSASVEGTLISVAGVLILLESVNNLLHPREINDLDIGLVLIVFAAIVNFAVGRIAINKGRKNRSLALEASGKHLCSDTYSSIGIILGLSIVYGAMLLGYNVWWMDPAMALIFGAVILYTGLRVVKESLDSFMDRADEGVIEELTDCLNENREVSWIDIHKLRVIKYGSTLHVDFHLTLPYMLTMEEEEVEKNRIVDIICKKFGERADITLAAEPCGGFNCRHCTYPCSRRTESFQYILEWNCNTITQDNQICSDRNVHFNGICQDSGNEYNNK